MSHTHKHHDQPGASGAQLATGRPVEAHLVQSVGLTRAYVLGLPITALCGHRFIPSRDPEGLPLCEGCTDIAAILHGAIR